MDEKPRRKRTRPPPSRPPPSRPPPSRPPPSRPPPSRPPPAGPSHRRATAVEPTRKVRSLRRLARIEGQVRGIARMVEEDRWCADVLVQIASVHESLRALSRELLENHLTNCAPHALAQGGSARDEMVAELVELMRLSGR
jgi:DNA-binding FrmR family transcriptional regulator